MKNRTNFLLATCLLSGILMVTGCKGGDDLPTVTTAEVTDITQSSATTGGDVEDDGGSEVTQRGVVWGTATGPTLDGNKTSDGTGTGAFTSSLTGLSESTTYYVRAYATNAEGTAYGNEQTFTTGAPGVAALTTVLVTDLTVNSAVTGGNIANDGGSPVTERGVVWGIEENPTIEDNRTSDGTGNGEFVSNITGLTSGTAYYIRSYAVNSLGVAYGNQIVFVTPVRDAQGNVYKATKIGNQIWMAENLRATRYSNNAAIPLVTDSINWMRLSTPAYTWYRNNQNNSNLGALYNWFAVNTGNLCPQGWHVPTEVEFRTMEQAVGMPADSSMLWGWRGRNIATVLKDSVGWLTGAGNNSSGFSAIGSGYRAWSDSQFRGRQEIAYWWTSTDDAINNKPEVAWYRRIDGASTLVYRASTEKEGGKSVRCIKNP
jgi:uncharacterized protein (TIGR02145 family)